MKVREILNTYEGFKALSEKELPFKAALSVAENMSVLQTAYDVANKKRTEIINNALALDDEGKPIKVGEDSYKLKPDNDLNEKMQELLEEEVETKELKKISSEKMGEISIEPKTLIAITDYIE